MDRLHSGESENTTSTHASALQGRLGAPHASAAEAAVSWLQGPAQAAGMGQGAADGSTAFRWV